MARIHQRAEQNELLVSAATLFEGAPIKLIKGHGSLHPTIARAHLFAKSSHEISGLEFTEEGVSLFPFPPLYRDSGKGKRE